MASLYLIFEGGLKALASGINGTSGFPSLIGKLISLPIDLYDKKRKQYLHHPEIREGMRNFHETRTMGADPYV
ncbi:MAG: hypothetical protein ABIJ20_02765 [Nanoarchaeota archaeon]|nr:hypothetical protein [Nanoarchaeota archaeon]MBU1445253.1 hypothetical protein [Nanoarchaeota archaeon]MBU2406508.1 hypothetical protein [Nanoarchaeota archaeon]MBU2420728.1 hypothetical protein [Nanoarchaeota archaeon]MBU2475514.1 hypothetical protein [Nanoarchaeota archaeon]